MELNVKSASKRVILERCDNGVMLYETDDEDNVTSKIVYEIYFKDGMINFSTVGFMINDILECLTIPTEEKETNSKLQVYITRLNPDEPFTGENEND